MCASERLLCCAAIFVVIRLFQRKRRRRLQHVHHAGHVFVHQTNHFVISPQRKLHRERLPFHQRRRGHPSRTVKARVIHHHAWASHLERQPHLPRLEKAHRVNFVLLERPGDALTFVDPDFIRQKRQSLPCFALPLRLSTAIFSVFLSRPGLSSCSRASPA